MSADIDIDTLIQSAKKLPPSPQVLPKLLAIIQDDDALASDIAAIIQLDPVLMAQVVALSNSVHYGFSSQSTSIEEAVSRIGMGEVYRLVGFLVAKRMSQESVSAYFLSENDLWENAIASALSMEGLAQLLNQNVPVAYTIGLLHGIGKLVINQLPGQRYEEVFKRVEDNGITLPEAEADVFSFNHGQIGEALLNKWDFPKEITIPIANQFRPLRAPSHKEYSCMLHLSNWIVACLGRNPGLDAWAVDMQSVAMEYLTLKEASMEKILLDTKDNLAKIQEMLSVTKNAKA